MCNLKPRKEIANCSTVRQLDNSGKTPSGFKSLGNINVISEQKGRHTKQGDGVRKQIHLGAVWKDVMRGVPDSRSGGRCQFTYTQTVEIGVVLYASIQDISYIHISTSFVNGVSIICYSPGKTNGGCFGTYIMINIFPSSRYHSAIQQTKDGNDDLEESSYAGYRRDHANQSSFFMKGGD